MALTRNELNTLNDWITAVGYKEAIKELITRIKTLEQVWMTDLDLSIFNDMKEDIGSVGNKEQTDGDIERINSYLYSVDPEYMISKMIALMTPEQIRTIADGLDRDYGGLHPDCLKCIYCKCSRTTIKKIDGACHIDLADK